MPSSSCILLNYWPGGIIFFRFTSFLLGFPVSSLEALPFPLLCIFFFSFTLSGGGPLAVFALSAFTLQVYADLLTVSVAASRLETRQEVTALYVDQRLVFATIDRGVPGKPFGSVCLEPRRDG